MKNHFFKSTPICTTSKLNIDKSASCPLDTDGEIESAITGSFVFKTYLKNDSVEVVSKNGIVTLTGSVSERIHKSLAGDTAINFPIVKGIIDQITVSKQPTDHESEKNIAQKVNALLRYHRNVNADALNIRAEGDTITLQGIASSAAQRDLTGEYAEDVEGVKTVNNELKIDGDLDQTSRTFAETIDDASITAQINGSLFTHRSTRAINTCIKTVEGVVTVSGTASSLAERNLVTRIIDDVHGVVHVINNMTVTEHSQIAGYDSPSQWETYQ